MKAKQENIVNTNRIALQTVLPLETPYSLFIDICNACNFKCKFCAIQYADRKLPFKKMAMDLDLYKKVIDELTMFSKPLKMLRLAANGEPLLNKHLPEMIAYARDKKIAEHIEIVTNGSLFEPELNKKLVQSGLNRVRISIEALDAVGYEEMSGVKLDWNAFMSNIQDFYDHRENCEVYIKTVDAAADTEEKKNKFYELFGDMCDKISIEHIIPIWVGWDEIRDDFEIEAEEGLHGHAVQDVRVCPFPFYSFVVNPDGEVTACCNDWERKIILGNVIDETIYDVWNGKIYHDFLIKMLKNGRRCNPACATCVYPCYDKVDNIDDFSDEVLHKFLISEKDKR